MSVGHCQEVPFGFVLSKMSSVSFFSFFKVANRKQNHMHGSYYISIEQSIARVGKLHYGGQILPADSFCL